MSDLSSLLKAAGFSLAQRKLIDSQHSLVSSLVDAVHANLGASFSVAIDWASVFSIGKHDESTAARVLKSLFEVLLPGLKGDVENMGTDELGALAGEYQGLIIQGLAGETGLVVVAEGQKVKIQFGVGRRVAYPDMKNRSLRAFVLETCEGGSDPATVLPKSSLGRKISPVPAFSIQFDPDPPVVQSPMLGWFMLPLTRDPKHGNYDVTMISIPSICAVRDLKVNGTELILMNGITLYSQVALSDVVKAISETRKH